MPDTLTGQGGAANPGTGAAGPIAIISHTHPSVSKGGAEIAAYALYEGLRALGAEAIFIAACPAADRDRLQLGTDREYIVAIDQLRYDHFYQLAARDVWRQLSAILLRNNVRHANFHHFLNYGVNTLRAIAAETDIPFTLTLHEFLSVCGNHGQMVTRPGRRLCEQAAPVACASCFPEHSRQQFVLRQELIQGALMGAAGFVSPSHFLADRMVQWGLPREKFVIIENGLRQPPPLPRRLRTGLDGSPWTFGYFGQITPFKGADTLLDTIELLARQPDIGTKIRIKVHGNLIGQSDDFMARFEASFAANRFATYAGPYDNADVVNLMSACDYVLVPSTWWENSPVVIQEAYAAGRPVICSGIGGMAEKVPNRRSGLHFRLNDAADLARVMAEAADGVLYEALCSGLPPVTDHVTMARDYLATFARLGNYAATDDTAALPRAAARRRRAALAAE